jgi:hypothetical protein
MGRLFPLLILAYMALLVITLVDCLSREQRDIRAMPKAAWVLVIVFLVPIGPILWLLAGRPAGTAATAGRAVSRGGGNGAPRPPRPVAPDDDPEFLSSLAQQRKDDEELLRQWEADLRRREDELRKPDGDEPTS